MKNAGLAKELQELDRAGQRGWSWQELPIGVPVAPLEPLGLLASKLASEFPGHGAREQAAAHADAAVDAPPVDLHLGFAERPLPGEDMSINGVHERSVEIKDERV